MEEIERFDVSCDGRGEVYESPGGEFVRHDDYLSDMSAKDAETANLRKKLTTCCFCGEYFVTLDGLKEHSKSCEKHPIASLKAKLSTARAALVEIGSFDEEPSKLTETDDYSMFDEPGSVRMARRALAALDAEPEVKKAEPSLASEDLDSTRGSSIDSAVPDGSWYGAESR